MSCSRTTRQWRWWGSNPRPLGLESSTQPLSHCPPINEACICVLKIWREKNALALYLDNIYNISHTFGVGLLAWRALLNTSELVLRGPGIGLAWIRARLWSSCWYRSTVELKLKKKSAIMEVESCSQGSSWGLTVGRSYSAKLRHFLSIKQQISHYTYYCHLMEGETQHSGSRLSDNVTTSLTKKKKNVFRETPTSPLVPFRTKFRPLRQLFRPSPP